MGPNNYFVRVTADIFIQSIDQLHPDHIYGTTGWLKIKYNRQRIYNVSTALQLCNHTTV